MQDWVFNGDSSSESGALFTKEEASGDEAKEGRGNNQEAPVVGSTTGGDNMMVLYIQMQLCEPINLFDWLQTPSREVIPGSEQHRECIEKFRQVVEGLKYVHEQRLIHRDLKPANVLMLKAQINGVELMEPGDTKSYRDIMKLADFGLSRSLPHSHVAQELNQYRGEYLPLPQDKERSMTMGIGTPTYTAPELLKKGGDGKCTYTAMADIFSVGIILCEIFNPFGSGMERARVIMQVRNGKVPASMEKNFPLETMLMRAMLSHDPLERPSAGAILEDDIFDLLEQTSVISPKNVRRGTRNSITLEGSSRYVATRQQELSLVVRSNNSSDGSRNLPEGILSTIHEWGIKHNVSPQSLPSGWQSNVDKGGDVMVLKFSFSGSINLEVTHDLKEEVEKQFTVTSVEFIFTQNT